MQIRVNQNGLTSMRVLQTRANKSLRDEFYVSSSGDLYSLCKMNIITQSVQSMGPKFVSHRIPAIDTLDENYGI